MLRLQYKVETKACGRAAGDDLHHYFINLLRML